MSEFRSDSSSGASADLKLAHPDHPIQDLFRRRFSPYVFEERPVERETLASVFEAARWSASSYNEQPWRFIVAAKDEPDAFEEVLGCLVEGNKAWARRAPVLALGVVSTRLARNDRPNRAAEHDLGLATAQLILEATARGVHVHPMIGILPERAAERFGVPDGYEVLTALAIGYRARPTSDAPEELRKRDETPRTRRPLTELVFTTTWGKAFL